MNRLGMHGRKWEIFENAIQLYSNYGYEKVSMKELAKHCGITAASLYNHFSSKEAILKVMYEFYLVNMEEVLPDLLRGLAQVPEKGVHELLEASVIFLNEELQPYMDKIYVVAIMRALQDKRAAEVVWRYNIAYPRDYLTALLQRMLELDRIEPLDIESFLNLFVSFGFTAVFRNNTTDPLGREAWQQGLKLLFSLVKEKERPVV